MKQEKYIHVSKLYDEFSLHQSLVVLCKNCEKFRLELWLKNARVIVGNIDYEHVILFRATISVIIVIINVRQSYCARYSYRFRYNTRVWWTHKRTDVQPISIMCAVWLTHVKKHHILSPHTDMRCSILAKLCMMTEDVPSLHPFPPIFFGSCQ